MNTVEGTIATVVVYVIVYVNVAAQSMLSLIVKAGRVNEEAAEATV